MSELRFGSEGQSTDNGVVNIVTTTGPNGSPDGQTRQASRTGSRSGPSIAQHGQATDSRSSSRSTLLAAVQALQVPATGEPTFREEARLEATPIGSAVAPAILPPSSKASQSSDDSAVDPASSRDASPAYSASPPLPRPEVVAQQLSGGVTSMGLAGAISAVTPVSLPGSLSGGSPTKSTSSGVGRFSSGGGGGGGGSVRHHQTGELLLMSADPESTDYVYEEKELERLSQSSDFLAETRKDPSFTLLHFVAMLGHKRLAEALPAEMISRHHHFARLARCLITRRNAEVFVKDKYGCTPLQLAAACGNTEMVRVLLEPYEFESTGKEVLPQGFHGYDYLNHQDSQINFSALHGAVSHDAHDAVILLLKTGANPQALDVTKKTAFEVAPTLVSLQELLRLAVQREGEVPRSVIVQLMAVVLDKQLKEGGTNQQQQQQQPQQPQQQQQQSGAAAAAAGGGGQGGGGGGASLQDAKSQRSFKAQQRWSKAARFAMSASQAPEEPSQRFTCAIIETIGHMQNADVGSTIKRHFGKLYEAKRYDVLVEYVKLAIYANHVKLTEAMIDRIANDCPEVFGSPHWPETLEPLVSTYPTLFHRLLFKLQDMRDEDVRGFVRCLSPDRLQEGADRRPQSSVGIAGISQRGGGMGGDRAHAVDRVKLLIYQQLVEGLKKVSYRIVKTFFEESDQRLLNDMAQFPIFAEFVGLVANLQTAKAIGESDGMRQALLDLLRQPKQPTAAAGPATAVVAAAAFTSAAAVAAAAAAAGPGTGGRPSGKGWPRASGAAGGGGGGGRVVTPPRPSDAPPVTVAWESEDSRKVIVKDGSAKVSFAIDAHVEEAVSGFEAGCCGPTGGPGGEFGPAGAGLSGGLSSAALSTASSGGLSTSVGRPVAESRRGDGVVQAAADRSESEAETDGRRIRLSLQTLNVQPVLMAAVKAGKADNVETAVMSVVSWVDVNSKDDKAVFLAGITADLIQELAMRFPSACASLLNVVSKDVMETLDTLQVSANVLYGRDHLVKCSHVRNHFTWRERELEKLMTHSKGYTEHVVDALVDYGVPFECVYKAAVEMGGSASPDQFAALIEHGFTGPEIKQLISNGIRLAKVIGYIQECAKPPPDGVGADFLSRLDVPMSVLLRDMLRVRLSPRVVDIILREGSMFETTKYNNFRPGRPLRDLYPEPLFVPSYTHHFVQMLLISWQRGSTNAAGKVIMAPWAKEFIDTVFEPNDPLCTKLKSWYDNKLTDTQVYIQGDADADGDAAERAPDPERKSSSALRERRRSAKEQADQDRGKLAYIRQLLRIFIGNYLLVHRWPVYLAAQLWLFVLASVQTYWQRLEDVYYREKARRFGLSKSLAKKARSGTIDAAVLAFPILGLVQPDGGDILTALVHADAPSSWFHYAIVRALYGLHWTNFGRVMVYLSAAVQLQFAAVFLVFFLLVLNYPPLKDATDDELNVMRSLPVIEGLLGAIMVLSASMLVERIQEARVPQLSTWVSVGRHLELLCHAMVWAVAGIVWSGRGANLVPALSGLTMLLFVARLTFFGLVTEKLSTAVLALLEILSDSRYFFLLIALVYGGFVLAVAGLRSQLDSNDAPTSASSSASVYLSQLFTVLLGDFQSTMLSNTDERRVWRFPDFSVLLLSMYAMLMMIVFMNLLIATMNDTYDRVKEFREVEVMRLRSHMMVFVKDFIKHTAKKKLEHLDGDVLHLLLRPEEVKSGRWQSQNASEPSEYSAWAGRITYMRSTIVREVEAVVSAQNEKTLEQLIAIEQRLGKVEGAAAAAAAAAAGGPVKAGAGAGGGAAGGAEERLTALEGRMEGLQRGVDALLARGGGGGSGS
ncbi:hypothetical protein PLESTB_000317700 [Pleodorina starrii]|uniref:Ion transport domain-containing protein n=1 Tax=Pleodorina starrii TaxID=330485 RepID=A0A9W6BCY8_9CHLO|nr:hypothetical protein PLESTM_001739400 [Pleodorina starrii]GLC49871.1 hypothetical protein PLESTB_000317700 [Pleodorina starrii]GLC68259.1 hypothetical protein PLESTF_000667700 [Pleodorina starrii]